MKISSQLADQAVLHELGGRLAQLRIERNFTQAALAEEAGVSKRTIERLEAGEVATQLSGFLRVCRALGVLERFENILPEPTPSPMAQLRQRERERKRQRATGKKSTPSTEKKWTWGDSISNQK